MLKGVGRLAGFLLSPQSSALSTYLRASQSGVGPVVTNNDFSACTYPSAEPRPGYALAWLQPAEPW